ncbi:zincin-like metallopeptidase domain-containing protein [Mesorhizobium sp. WSM4887]|uniref:ArdC family protein n=1 Tax=Mesorhizobium sp. WSM4887 TaxID=3038543 RepID=UPI002416B006|nr:zincin-like metallopeptidase domain-containing protein [Mesorhizobium sp. WSM4887]MDG4889698.1 zincin-like metallopeptidase domain-containing protein [Mesorhizobium sp. WSM4887]
MTKSIYQRVTETLLAQIDGANPREWACPWHRTGGLPKNGKTGANYRGINILGLWCAAQRLGFGDTRWATYRQWQGLGAQVRRGEKGSFVHFYRDMGSSDESVEGHDRSAQGHRRYVMRTSVVFNADQVDGVFNEPAAIPARTSSTDTFDEFMTATGAAVRFGGNEAFYCPVRDEIHVPPLNYFNTPEGYTATLGHELLHWTGAKSRLSRNLSGRYGELAYAAEELVAEIGSAFLLAGLGLANTPHPNHARYLASWLPLLRKDPRAIFTAAAQASRAVDWLGDITSQATRLSTAAAAVQVLVDGPRAETRSPS